MILDARELVNGHLLEADVAIIGAGPAGITLALDLIGSGLSVLLLESGGIKAQRGPHEPFTGEVADPRHPPSDFYRTQALGGTSTLWGGRCVPFDPIDFEARPHIPHSGWPIAYDEMLPWYRRAGYYCESGPFHFRVDEALGAGAAPMVPGIESEDISCRAIERFSPPTDFGRRHGPALAAHPNVRVVLWAACTAIEKEPSGRAVRALRCASAPDRTFTVKARWYVLAAGGLETARLMLASAVGNSNVGRFYMCHVEGKAAVAHFVPGTPVVFRYERDQSGVYMRRRFTVPAETQRRLGLTNVILRIESPLIADPAHRDPILSAIWISRTFLKPEYARKIAAFGHRGKVAGTFAVLAAQHARNIILGAPELACFAADWLTRHVLAARKLPYVVTRGPGEGFTLDYNGEQIPNPNSRVTLGDETDRFGVPRIKVDWRASPQDIAGVLETHRLLARRLEASGIGKLDIDEDAIRQGYGATGGHHIGTARMAADPADGVVDRDGTVFGMDNLFVAGAAAFATSSHANPTLTLVALSARLAAHIDALARRRLGTKVAPATNRHPMAAE